MSVVKRKRSESPFEVYTHWTRTEREITQWLLLRNFGFMPALVEKRKTSLLRGRNPEDMTESQFRAYQAELYKDAELVDWYCIRRRNKILDCMDEITRCIRMANGLYPYYMDELIERRKYQDEAIGYLYTLEQYIQTTAENVPVDKNRLLRFGPLIEKEIALIKGWRKADNKFRKQIETRNNN